MTLEQLIEYVETLHNDLQLDLVGLSEEMDSLDPAAKSFEDLDIEYNFISGQVVALGHILQKAIGR